MNKDNPNQLFLGTYRLYRTDNAEAARRGDVHWDPISGDLTTGCTGTAPNGARGCFISAVGVADGGDAVYTGSDDGKVFVNPHAVSVPADDADAWTRRHAEQPAQPTGDADRGGPLELADRLPVLRGLQRGTPRPLAVTSSRRPNGGQTWTDISNGLPDVPTNSVVLDPSFPNTLYAGTDIGAFVTTNGGGSWSRLGTGDADGGRLAARLRLQPPAAARRHPRPRRLHALRQRRQAPALDRVQGGQRARRSARAATSTTRSRCETSATPTRRASRSPTRSRRTPPSSSAADGGDRSRGGTVTWIGQTVPAGGSVDAALHGARSTRRWTRRVTEIVDDGLTVTADGGFGTTGSPHDTPIAPPYAVERRPGRPGRRRPRSATSVDYTVHVTNDGYRPTTTR